MTDEQLHTALSDLVDREDITPDLVNVGKALPYYGWWWRTFDWNRVPLARAGTGDFDFPPWTGFCANNKWDYPCWTATREQSEKIRALCEAFVVDPSKATATAVYEYLQTLEAT
jgi:hypothetical protein